MTCVCGIDPGLSGAIAFFYTKEGRIEAEDMPVVAKTVDAWTLSNRILEMKTTRAIVESVHSMPKQGVASSFCFGQTFGTVLGVLGALAIPYELVTPQMWKKYFRLDGDKDKSIKLIKQKFPASEHLFRLQKHHGRAEAALLALYLASQ